MLKAEMRFSALSAADRTAALQDFDRTAAAGHTGRRSLHTVASSTALAAGA
jgi:hypothetical protein